MTLPLTPWLAPWVVPSSLGLLALLLSGYLVLSVRRRRLAEVVDLAEVEGLPERADDPDVRVLKRQVEVLTRTLAEWDREQAAAPRPAARTERAERAEPEPSPTLEPGVRLADPASPGREEDPPAAGAGVPPLGQPVGPSTAYAALSRDRAREGDVVGAVLAQWAADLQVLRPALGTHAVDLARAVADVRHDDPVAALRACREAALGLVRTAGSVRALLSPLDHLGDLADRGSRPQPGGRPDVPPVLPRPLLDLLPTDQCERLSAAGLAG